MGVVLLLLAEAIGARFGEPAPQLVRIAALAGLVGSGFATYVAAVFLTGAMDMAQLRRFLRRRTPPPGPI